MSPIPSPPTDNLYKFCAVAGSLAIIISGLVVFQAWRDVLREQHSTQSTAEELSDTMKLAELVSKPWSEPQGDSPEDIAAKAEFQVEAQKIKSRLDESLKKLVADSVKLNFDKYDFKIVGLTAGVIAIVGLILGIYGFRNWRKLQLKQDQLLDLELQPRRVSARSASTHPTRESNRENDIERF